MAQTQQQAAETRRVNQPTAAHRLVHAGFNGFAFGLCYLLAAQVAAQSGVTRNVALPWDRFIPFVSWMLLPYLSSGVFFVASFFAVRSSDALRVLSQRMLVATVLAGLVFVTWPLRFSFTRPTVEPAWLGPLFGLLDTTDGPYNQLPSLHVAFCVLWWSALRRVPTKAWSRGLLSGWLALTAAATLFTYQHHLLDMAAGLGLGLLCIALVRPCNAEPNVMLYYLLASGVALVVGIALWPLAATLYMAASLWLVALAYWRGDRGFLHKREGRHPWWVMLAYAPYLIGYRLTWLAQARRGHPALRQIGPRLWIGRRLHRTEVQLLPAGCTVIDLSAELPETPDLRRGSYLHVPLLDIVAPPDTVLRQVAAVVQGELDAGRSVYLHCAMGLRRCVAIAEVAQAMQKAPSTLATSGPCVFRSTN